MQNIIVEKKSYIKISCRLFFKSLLLTMERLEMSLVRAAVRTIKNKNLLFHDIRLTLITGTVHEMFIVHILTVNFYGLLYNGVL